MRRRRNLLGQFAGQEVANNNVEYPFFALIRNFWLLLNYLLTVLFYLPWILTFYFAFSYIDFKQILSDKFQHYVCRCKRETINDIKNGI